MDSNGGGNVSTLRLGGRGDTVCAGESLAITLLP